jgi:preprotein translocase subunit SecG
MTQILLIIHIIIVVSLIGTILMQRSGADGLAGMGGGGTGNFMSGRGAANAMTKATAILATLFIINSLALAIIASKTERSTSIIEKIITEDIQPRAEKIEEAIEESTDSPVVPFAE